jgi:Zn-dependent metalloprotease
MKTLTYLTWTTLLLLMINTAGLSQKSNPFSVKQKHTLHQKVFHPAPLTMKNSSVSRNIPDGDFTIKSTPFKMPVLNSKFHFSQIDYDKNGLLSFVVCDAKEGIPYSVRSTESYQQAAFSFMNDIKRGMHIEKPEEEFQAVLFWNDDLGADHIKMQQYYKGVKVYGGQVILHGKDGLINKMNGTYFPTPKINDLNPQTGRTEAEEIVKKDVASFTQYIDDDISKNGLLSYNETETELVIYHHKLELANEKLVWHITVRPNILARWEYFIDANTGEVINKYDNTCSDGPATANAVDLNGVTRTINTYKVGSYYYLINTTKPMFNGGQSDLPNNPVGAIWTIDANNSNDGGIYQVTSPSNTWSDPSSVSAHYNADNTYNYYKNTHGRNSIDGNGGTIISIVNVVDENGNSLANAYWNGRAMFYGNGGNIFKPLAGAEDVGAHEMTHGVIQNTANLEYQYESGAINEAMADIGGAMVDRDNWQIGEKIVPAGSPYFPTGTLRDMSNPHNGGSSFNDPSYQPANVNEKYTGESDNGGVHINSGIINFAYYKIAEAITKNKAEKLFYRALATYMTKSSQFIDCRLAFEQAAKDIYGDNSTELSAVSNAFYQVGIGDSGTGGGGGGGASTPAEIEVNPGQDYLLSYDVNPSDPNTLYISSTDGTDFNAISQTKLKRRPSLVDNGSWAVMISESNEMRSIAMSGNYDEQVMSQDLIWDNVAVSKDGNRIAAITTAVDSAIYIYDFGKGTWAKYHLYNPTFTPDVTVDNVLYADALEWDYTGQYLIYDAYNEMKNNDGENIDYWDVGVIRVWNNSSNTWGDGKIEKVFTGLPEGVSIGNPSFSKNSPYIIAFDYFNANDNTFAVLGANLETGDVSVIYENNDLGFPNYSKLDDIVVFGTSYQNQQVIGEIGVKSDKITPDGNAYVLVDVAKWPVWYATGNRDLTDVEKNSVDPVFFSNVYPNPSKGNISVVFEGAANREYVVAVYNIFGQKVVAKSGHATNGLNKIQISLNDLAGGTYVVKIQFGNQVKTHKIVKMD